MTLDAQEKKRRAALAALDYVREGMILGVGTGSTVNAFIDALAESGNASEGGGLEAPTPPPPASPPMASRSSTSMKWGRWTSMWMARTSPRVPNTSSRGWSGPHA